MKPMVVENDNRIYVWRKADERYRSVCKFEGCPDMFWSCITYDSVKTLTDVDGTMGTDNYIQTLDNHLWPIVAKHFPNSNISFKTIKPLVINQTELWFGNAKVTSPH